MIPVYPALHIVGRELNLLSENIWDSESGRLQKVWAVIKHEYGAHAVHGLAESGQDYALVFLGFDKTEDEVAFKLRFGL